MAATTEPWVSNRTAQAVSTYVQYISPLLLLVVFLAAFISQSIVTSAKVDDLKSPTKHTGPGGKPLPRTNSPAAKEKLQSQTLDFSPGRKLLFTCLSAILLLTFVGNAAIVILHTLTHREENWWCGQSVVVCRALPRDLHMANFADRRSTLWPLFLSTRLSSYPSSIRSRHQPVFMQSLGQLV